MDAASAEESQPPPSTAIEQTASSQGDDAIGADAAAQLITLRLEVDQLVARVDELIARRLAERRLPRGRPGAA
jgi:hypothetical protein